MSFFRFFPVPGMGHCSGGVGPSTFDGLAAVEQWVERGKAPESIPASHSSGGAVDRTRPLARIRRRRATEAPEASTTQRISPAPCRSHPGCLDARGRRHRGEARPARVMDKSRTDLHTLLMAKALNGVRPPSPRDVAPPKAQDRWNRQDGVASTTT